MESNEFTIWRLVLDHLSIFDCLPLFCVCRQFNYLYSKDDWTRLYIEISRDNVKSSNKEECLGYYRQTLDLRLRGIRKHYHDRPFNMFMIFQRINPGPLDELDWSNNNLSSLYRLYEKYREHEQKVYQARDGHLPLIDMGLSIFENRLTREEMKPLYDFSEEYRKTEPNPIKLVALVKASRDLDPLIRETADKVLTECRVM